jgi:hypothetical protein
VQCLQEESVDVDWTPPTEERGVHDVAEHPVTVTIIANGTWAAITAGVRKFRERFKRGRVKVEGQDDE